MAFTGTAPTNDFLAMPLGPWKMQLVKVQAASGDTTGSLTADRFHQLSHVIMPNGFKLSAAPTFATNVATLAFTVPTATAATKAIQDLTYTSVATSNEGNLISVAYTAGGTAGAEVVTVTSNAISIQIETAVSTATQVKAAFDASAAAIALASCAISGTGSTAQVTATAALLTGGITGGAFGAALCIGR